MYLANTAILNITPDYEILLRLVNTFTADTDEYYPMCYKVNDAKTFKNLALHRTTRSLEPYCP